VHVRIVTSETTAQVIAYNLDWNRELCFVPTSRNAEVFFDYDAECYILDDDGITHLNS